LKKILKGKTNINNKREDSDDEDDIGELTLHKVRSVPIGPSKSGNSLKFDMPFSPHVSFNHWFFVEPSNQEIRE
jgi:hypothetical protein